MKNYNNFFNMHCDVHYYSAKFEIKIHLYMKKKKGKLYYRVKWTKLHSLEDKLNQIIF